MVHLRSCWALGTRFAGGAAKHYGELKALKAAAALGSSVLNGLPCQIQKYSPTQAGQMNRMSCCAKVEVPPPREVLVEYHEKPESTDYFIKIADGIENAHPDIMVLGNENIQPRDGAFEVTAGEHILFSKLKEHRLPRLEEILIAINQIPTQALSCEKEKAEKHREDQERDIWVPFPLHWPRKWELPAW